MNKITNRQAICDTLLKLAETDKDIFVLCSDSRGSASLTAFANEYPEQFIEIGIAEQNLVSVGAGLATCGKKVYVASPASFLATRSYEQIKVDVAYSQTNVTLIGISGGVSYGALGSTHHSLQDIAALTAIPDLRVYLPSDRFQTAELIKAINKDKLPSYIRVSRTPSKDIYDENYKLELNKSNVIKEGKDVAIIACGEMVAESLEAAELLKAKGIDASVVDMYCLKPMDKQTVISVSEKAKLVVTVEEHSSYGGLGAQVAQIIGGNCPKRMLNIALPDEHLVAGTNTEIFAHYGLDGKGISEKILRALK